MGGQKKELKKGWTTGTCAQAATRAATECLLMGVKREKIKVYLPAGQRIELPVKEYRIVKSEKNEKILKVTCGIQKYSGDDPDITNGVMVYSTVSMTEGETIAIDGGEGIGRVTKEGLDQPVGNAAINTVPRKMIAKEAREVRDLSGYTGGLRIIIEIPGGDDLAKKTFNPRIGIEGGLSILGTSGIVEPMSEQALIDTIEVEIKVKLAAKQEILLAAPGNYGLDFLKEKWQIRSEEAIKCSNYVGDTIDLAARHGAKGLLFAAHIGKFVKVAGGIMNTHSRYADCRMEILSAAALRAGLGGEIARNLLCCNTTEDALQILDEEKRNKVMHILLEKIHESLNMRSGDALKTGAIVFSNTHGMLGMTKYASDLIQTYKQK